MTHLKHVVLGLAAGAAAMVPAIVRAQPPIVVEAEFPTAAVSYADLDLSRPAGVARLNGRIRRAAEELCVDEAVRNLARTAVARACLTAALASTEGQVERAIALYGTPQFAARGTIAVAGR